MMRIATIVLVCLVVVIGIAYDVAVVFFNDEKRDSISEVIRDAGRYVGAIPFSWGVLGGHFFWPGDLLFDQPWAAIALGSTAVAISIFTGFARHFLKLPTWTAMIWLLTGIPLGHFLWPLGAS